MAEHTCIPVGPDLAVDLDRFASQVRDRMQMSDLALIAAQEWARARAENAYDPVQFGASVAKVFLACQAVAKHAGNATATAVALTELSAPDETLRLIGRLAEHLAGKQAPLRAAGSNGSGAE